MNSKSSIEPLNDPDIASLSDHLVDGFVRAVIDRLAPTKNPAASADTCTASLQPTGSDAGGQTRTLMNDEHARPKPGNAGLPSGGNQSLLPSPTGYGHSLETPNVFGGSSGESPLRTLEAYPNDYPCKCYRCSVCGGKQTHPNQPSPYYPQPYIAPYITYNT